MVQEGCAVLRITAQRKPVQACRVLQPADARFAQEGRDRVGRHAGSTLRRLRPGVKKCNACDEDVELRPLADQ